MIPTPVLVYYLSTPFSRNGNLSWALATSMIEEAGLPPRFVNVMSKRSGNCMTLGTKTHG